MSPIADFKINGLPFISGNALASIFTLSNNVDLSILAGEKFRIAYPEFADSIIVKKLDYADHPFGGHTIAFTSSEAECWFRLKYG